jgi:hypothetical protein
MKIWLDDVREAPEGWTHRYKAYSAIHTLSHFDCVTDISLDHDLGNAAAGTGYDVVKWIEERVQEDYNYFPPRIFVHSDNPVGRANMWAAIQSINRMMTARYEDWIRPR